MFLITRSSGSTIRITRAAPETTSSVAMPARCIPQGLGAAEPIASRELLSYIRLTRIGPARFSSGSSSASRTFNLMETLTKSRGICEASGKQLSARFCAAWMKSLALFLLAGTMMLSACGGGSSASDSQIPPTLSGNWQFTMAPPSDGSFLGGLQGGFLLQNNGSVTGAATYAVSLPNFLIPCNTGSAAITGTISGESIKTITGVAGTQTFTLTGTLSLDGRPLPAPYQSSAGPASDVSLWVTVHPGLKWRAILAPPLSGSLQGN